MLVYSLSLSLFLHTHTHAHITQTSKKPLFMQQPPVRSIGEVTSDLSTTTTGDNTTTSVPSTEQNEQTALAENGSAPSLPSLRPSVVCWEELSGYTGFKPLEVEAGLQASLRMFVLHTQQIFFRETRNYDELMCQVCQ